MRVWFGSQGSYSDYGVEHVFASRELAERWAAAHGYGFVEPDDDVGFEVLDDLGVPELWAEFQCKVVDGVEFRRARVERQFSVFPRCVERSARSGVVAPGRVWIRVIGPAEWAGKVFSERRARAIAGFDAMGADWPGE